MITNSFKIIILEKDVLVDLYEGSLKNPCEYEKQFILDTNPVMIRNEKLTFRLNSMGLLQEG